MSERVELVMENLSLKINNLTKDEVKEIMQKIREMEQRNPDKMYFTQIGGLEQFSVEEVSDFMLDVFPQKKGK
jgi:hypothetical protein